LEVILRNGAAFELTGKLVRMIRSASGHVCATL
jgi:hypothetical protein